MVAMPKLLCLLCEKSKTGFTFAVRRFNAPLAPPANLLPSAAAPALKEASPLSPHYTDY